MVLLGKRPVEESLPVLGAVFADFVVGALRETLLIFAEPENLVDAAVEGFMLTKPALLVLAEVRALVDAAVERLLLTECVLLVFAEVESLVDTTLERLLPTEPALLVLVEAEALVDDAVEGFLLAERTLLEDALLEGALLEDAARVLWAFTVLLDDVFRVLPEMDDDFPLDAAVFVTVKVAVDDLTVDVVVVSEMLMQEHADEEPETDEQITVGPKLDVVEPVLDMPLRHRLPCPPSSAIVAFRRVVAFWYLVEVVPAGRVKVVVIVRPCSNFLCDPGRRNACCREACRGRARCPLRVCPHDIRPNRSQKGDQGSRYRIPHCFIWL